MKVWKFKKCGCCSRCFLYFLKYIRRIYKEKVYVFIGNLQISKSIG